MRIQYRVKQESVEVVRVYGVGDHVRIPEKIADKPVRTLAAYAFSIRKGNEDTDILEAVIDDETSGIFEGEEQLMAGPDLISVRFPDTVEEIGNYIFYGCKNLRSLTFSDSLMSIGSGAFTGCGMVNELHIRMLKGKKHCLKEILGDLWQRIDITFEASDGRRARFVFPEHYEEAVENTPARNLFTQQHGVGNRYRQCFYNRELDVDKYDAQFSMAIIEDSAGILTELVFSRLEAQEFGSLDHGFNVSIAKKDYDIYIRYLEEETEEVLKILLERDQIVRIQKLLNLFPWSQMMIDQAIELAARLQKQEALSLLMDEKRRLFPEKKRRKFAL